MNSNSDKALMLKVKKGELDKLGLLFERYHRGLYRYFYRMCRDKNTSEDLVQSVFERLLKYRQSYTGDGKFSTWLFSIARNQFNDHHRRSERIGNPVQFDEDRFEMPEEKTGPVHQAKEKKEILEEALYALPEDYREVIILSRYEGLRYNEIAEILESTEGAIKVKMFRAMKELKDIALSFEKEYNYE